MTLTTSLTHLYSHIQQRPRQLYTNFFLFFSSLILLYFSFPNTLWQFGIFAWVAFIPLFILIKKYSLSLFKTWVLTWVYFLLFFYVLFYFTPQELPSYLSVENNTLTFKLIYIIFPLIYSALITIISRLFHWKNPLTNALCHASLWTITEVYLLDYLFSFPLSLGLTQCSTEAVVQLASIGGIPMVSFTIIFIQSLLLHIIFFKNERKKICLFIVFIVSMVIIFGEVNFSTHKLHHPLQYKASLIQPNFSQYDLSISQINHDYLEWKFNVLTELSSKAKHEVDPDIIFWPESIIQDAMNNGLYQSQLTAYFKKIKTPVVFQGRLQNKKKKESYSAIFLYIKGELENIAYKNKLVPFLETIEFDNSPTSNVFVDIKTDLHLGTMICFDILFEKFSRLLAKNGATVLSCLSNTGYFGKSNWPFLHAAYVPFRAAETGRPFIFINNTGASLVSNSQGKITHFSPFKKRSISNVTFTPHFKPTFFMKYPYLFIFLVTLILMIRLIRFIQKRRWY